MAEKSRFRPPPEPAHVSVVRYYDEMVAILKQIRQGQEAIDRAFDEISSKIGFVVATTVPATLTLKEGGGLEHVALRGEHLKGTLFHDALLPILEKQLEHPMKTKGGGALQKGTYDFYLIWFEALKLKLGTINFRPPPEPAHFRPPPEPVHFQAAHVFAGDSLGSSIFRPPPEPAHWFDPGVLISEREQVLIVALDEVYGELKLLERIGSFRQLPATDMG